MRRIAAALVHYPVLDRAGSVVTSAITNIDLHDISRSAYSFGVSDLFVVHPIAAQRTLAQRVREHWVTGPGARRIPDRTPAMQQLRIVPTLEDAVAMLADGVRGAYELWVTSARAEGSVLTYPDARSILRTDGPPVLIVLGTGWGLAPTIADAAHARLAPLESPRADGYNHLSVRAAAAIMFDRLLSESR